jgi:hypothetical protein
VCGPHFSGDEGSDVGGGNVGSKGDRQLFLVHGESNNIPVLRAPWLSECFVLAPA